LQPAFLVDQSASAVRAAQIISAQAATAKRCERMKTDGPVAKQRALATGAPFAGCDNQNDQPRRCRLD